MKRLSHLNKSHHPGEMQKCKRVKLPKEEMDALISSSILSPGCDMYINTVPSFKINNEELSRSPVEHTQMIYQTMLTLATSHENMRPCGSR